MRSFWARARLYLYPFAIWAVAFYAGWIWSEYGWWPGAPIGFALAVLDGALMAFYRRAS